jgi:hypothetical protein
MPINPDVMRQVNYDASVGGRNMPQNAMQRAQNFLRNKLFGKPTNPAGMTSQQQTAFDAKQGGRAMRDFAKTRIKKTPGIGPIKGVGGALGKGGAAVTGLAIIEAGLEASGTDYGRKITAGKNEQSRQIEEMLQNPLRPTGESRTGGLPADYKSTEQKAFSDANIWEGQKNRKEQLENGGVPGQLPASAGPVDTGRNVTTTNANGVVQTGTSTSPKPMTMDDANKLLTGGYTMNQQYASNQLPTTASSPYEGKSNAQIYNPETLHQHDSDVDYVSLSKNLDEDKSGVELATRNGAMKTDYKQMDVNPGEKVPEEKINWANRTMADNSDEKLARRRAFLDAKGSMQGLRRSEAVQNMTYYGGQHYIGDGKGGKDLIAITDRDDVYKYKEGPEGARQIRDKYVDALTSKDDSVEYQTDAPAPLPDSVPSNTSMDKSPFDTEDLMQMQPSKSITGDDKPYTSLVNKNLF